MLVLARKVGERVILTLPDGRAVAVEVVELRNRQGAVRLGVDAPRDVPVDREEVHQRKGLDKGAGP